MIVVIDTNVWVSGLQFGAGIPSLALERASERDVVAIADELETEIYRILNLKFLWPPRRIREAVDVVLQRQLRLTLVRNVHVCRDPKDDMFLECASLASADLLVTGDKDLLSLASYGSARIVTPLEYVGMPV